MKQTRNVCYPLRADGICEGKQKLFVTKPKTGKPVDFSCMKETQNTRERDLKIDWKRWLNYQSLVRQLPFFLFLAILAVLYIYNGHYADKTIRNINRTAREVKELQYEYKTVKSEVMFRSKQSELVKAVEPLGLKELTIAPVILKDSVEN